MAFTSYDELIASVSAGKSQEIQFAKALPIAGAAGICVSLWEADSIPPGGGSGTSLVGRNCGPSTTGALAFANPTAPDTLHLISAQAYASASSLGSLVIYDRLADVGGISMTTTAPQAITMGALPRFADGSGVQLFLEVSTTITGAPTLTINYLDQDGNSATTPALVCAANAAGRFAYSNNIYIPLAAGDTGVRSVSQLTCSVAGSAGVARLVFARPYAQIPLLAAASVTEKDYVTQTPKLPRIFDNHCLAAFLFCAGTSTGTIYGSLTAAAG
jgi:hypothetical protein